MNREERGNKEHMTQQGLDLNSIFNVALQAMSGKRQEVNALDGYNGNHGDNMVQNLQLITNALRDKSTSSPSDALHYASEKLQQAGAGGTSQYYAQGLQQASQQLQGRSTLDQNDVVTLVQTLLGAIPNQGHPEQPQATESVLGQLLNLGQQAVAPQPQQPAPQNAAGMLGQLLGLGQAPAPQAQQPAPQADGLGLDDVVNTLLPAGLAFFQAKRGGADTASAAGQALTQALLGKSPAAANTPRAAAGTIIAQSILQQFLK